MTDASAVDDGAALILIDLQRGFDEADFWGRRDNPDAERNAARLVQDWRRRGAPIVVVRHDSVNPASPLHPSRPGNALKDVAREVTPALFVTKTVNSAFYGEPDLDGWLRGNGIGQIVLAGIQTNMCCETTARMAGNLGYEVLFAIDAMHTFDLEGPTGETLSAEELTRATATTLHGGGFARVVGTDELLAATNREA